MASTQHTSSESLIVGVYALVQHAANVVDGLFEAGFEQSSLGMLVSDRTAERHFGPPDARNERGAAGTYSANMNRMASSLAPMAALGTPASGLVATGPLAAALVTAGLGSRAGLEQALVTLGIEAEEAREVARLVKNGAVLVSARIESAEQAARCTPHIDPHAAISFEVRVEHPLAARALVTRPIAPPGDQRARYQPAVELKEGRTGALEPPAGVAGSRPAPR